ncbi:TetR/AcrR family transcriptional regulator [Streptomyces sp. NPDC051561]|uniref:TetR/AcrR family transcriptional regulator n=1 Tax=Streptomyces sp. NPDC051561 TaxID=3365658 RepID=UPI003788408F
MSRGETHSTPERPTGRGRIDKRRAILDAAIRVFAREGYAQAGLDAIAAEAGVAKPTIYNHFGGKETLFREAVMEATQRSSTKSLAALEGFPTSQPDDLRTELEGVATRLVACFRDENSWALQRLLYAETVRFPTVFDDWRAGGPAKVSDALAGRLARLANAGHLDISEPDRAAGQFLALIADDMPMLSALGTRPIDDEALRRAVESGVETFLKAFAAKESEDTQGDGAKSARPATRPGGASRQSGSKAAAKQR